MPLVHLSPYCQQQNCPIAASSSSSTTPLMSSYSTPAPSSSSSNTCSDPNNMITHTTISLRKRRMPCQRRRKTHYCYGCEAKVWVHLHSDTLVPICHRCLGAFVVAIREGSSASVQAAPASARHHHRHHHPLPTPPTPPASAATTTTSTSVSPNICTQDPSSHVSLFERLVHCFPIKRTTTATTTTCPVPRPLDYNDVCPICYDTLVSQHEQPVHLAPCMHTFHRACIEQWILGYKTTCPYCCQPTSLSRIQAIDTMH
ncbi:hypothetical protein O0I10_012713 [Lichtheimia ornata]|uniref:RING-type domain-containing protein n=1 Tax=Lichtheimia ornata TaxID=688661 RepID=A0AAD7XRH4_9FUNG|nr:uncharacterized protein O0I10_012713 [Lichtheimia ornata]KAJ8651725.1 hypothetical protein O0I10_012713 [Lichtheimia ornata]